MDYCFRLLPALWPTTVSELCFSAACLYLLPALTLDCLWIMLPTCPDHHKLLDFHTMPHTRSFWRSSTLFLLPMLCPLSQQTRKDSIMCQDLGQPSTSRPACLNAMGLLKVWQCSAALFKLNKKIWFTTSVLVHLSGIQQGSCQDSV